MADIEKGLPVRSEDDLQQKVQTKWVDENDPNGVGRQATVSEKKGHVRNFSKDSDGNDQEVLLSQEGHTQSNGDYDAATNKRPSSQGFITSDRSAAPTELTMNKRPTAIAGEDDTVNLDVSLHDHAGQNYDENNPLPVHIAEDIGVEVCDYLENDIAADASGTHSYSIPDGKHFLLHQVACASSGRSKVLVEIGDGGAVEVFTPKRTLFCSESGQDNQGIFQKPIKITGTVNTTTLRLTKTNRDDDDQASVYTSIIGILKDI